jgi:acetyl esterase/lipase
MSQDILELPPPPADERYPYGPEASQFAELRLPVGAGPHPVVVAIHGGYWRARYDLAYLGHVCAALTARGFATWNVEYRRLGQRGGGWPGTLQDVARAADALREVADRYALDLARVVTLGHSAGGQLALWLAGRHRIAADSPVAAANPLPLAGAVSLAGVLDLRRAWELRLSSQVTDELLGGSPERHPERYAAASPSELVPLGAPQVLLHGTADANVPFEISERYAEVAHAAGDSVELIVLPGAGHFEVVDPRSAEWPEVVAAVERLAT